VEPDRGAVQLFAEHLRQLRVAAGNPSLTRLVRLSGDDVLRTSTIHDHLSGGRIRLPSWEFVRDFYSACQLYAQSTGRDATRLGSLDDWARRYDAAQDGDSQAPSPVRDAPADVLPRAEPPELPEAPASQGAAAARVPAGERARWWSRRAYQVVAVAFVLVAVVAAGIVILRLGSRRPQPAMPAELVWSYQTGNSSVDGSPVAAGGLVYIGDDSGTLYALDAGTGQVRWSVNLHGQIDSRPCVAGGTVYIGNDADRFYAINAATGAVRWMQTVPGGIDSSPTVAAGIVYFGDGNNQVRALSVAHGKSVWTYTTGQTVQSSPVVTDGIVYVGSEDGKVYALTAATGALRWATPTGGPVNSSPVVAAGTVYIGSDDHNLYELSAGTGKVVTTWRTGGAVVSSPFVYRGVIYVGSDDGNVYAFTPTSQQPLWVFPVGGQVVSSPFVSDGVVYVGSAVGYNNGSLYAITVHGTELWVYQTGGEVTSSPAVANGLVYVGSDNDEVVAVKVTRAGPK
jgi:outer membrane protein assembly factor BamB